METITETSTSTKEPLVKSGSYLEQTHSSTFRKTKTHKEIKHRKDYDQKFINSEGQPEQRKIDESDRVKYVII